MRNKKYLTNIFEFLLILLIIFDIIPVVMEEKMANIKSSIKSIELDKARTLKNKIEKTKILNATKKYKSALAENDIEKAEKLLSTANSVIDKACKKGTIHKSNADRKKSRLAKLKIEKK